MARAGGGGVRGVAGVVGGGMVGVGVGVGLVAGGRGVGRSQGAVRIVGRDAKCGFRVGGVGRIALFGRGGLFRRRRVWVVGVFGGVGRCVVGISGVGFAV